jgi:hypothetical protein
MRRVQTRFDCAYFKWCVKRFVAMRCLITQTRAHLFKSVVFVRPFFERIAAFFTYPYFRHTKMNLDEEIIRCHREGLTPEATFQHLCLKHNFPTIPANQADGFFNQLDMNSSADVVPNFDYDDLLNQIHQIFGKIQNTISVWPNVIRGSMYFLDDRYALALCGRGNRVALKLLDIHYGQKR